MGNKNQTILLVDDEPALLEATAEYLREEFIVHLASNGAEAWEILNKEKIDCLVTDIRMPVMDGYELLEKIYHSEINIKTIAISGFMKSLDFKRFKELELDSHLLKPFDVQDLNEIIRDVLKDC